jgi:hypothetical protein
MSRILTLFLILHWAAVFSLLAALAVFGGDGGADGFSFFGVPMSAGGDVYIASVPVLRAAVTLGFAFCAVLFWWAFVTLFVSSDGQAGDEVLRMAFAAASGLMTLMLVVGAVKAPAGLFAAMAAHFAALIASYLAIRGEQQLGEQVDKSEDELRLAARVRAIDASQTARLSRFVATHDGRRSFDR